MIDNLEALVDELRKLPSETEWLEFKKDNFDPEMIGADISALANGAALRERRTAYLVWGIENQTHEVEGTERDFRTMKRGNELLENWLRRMLSQNADFEFVFGSVHGRTVGLLSIVPALGRPVTFEKEAYIRAGSSTKKLRDVPALEAALWDRLRSASFETGFARTGLTWTEALRFLDTSAYFDFLNLPSPTESEGIVHYLKEDGILTADDDGRCSVSNLGALALAKSLSDFPTVSRKALRLVQYEGKNRLSILRQWTEDHGYAFVLRGLMDFVLALIPASEPIEGATRIKKTAYPLLAIRELVANALIHQNFSVSGAGPVVEFFENRIEITNPGPPLVEVARIVDNPPKSRNPRLASLLRRFGLCEELGTGWDKIISECEKAQLPAPKMEVYDEGTKVTLFSRIPFQSMSLADKLHAAYMHACIRHIQGERATNRSLRNRFGLPDTSAGSISRLFREAVSRGLLKPFDLEAGNRLSSYEPFWA